MLIPSDPVNAFVDYPDAPVPNAPDGPLAGLTFAVKDIFDVAGYPTGCGNPLKRAESGAAATSAPAVRMLLDAGARFVGKTHTAELAFSLDGINTHYGTPTNPAAPDRVPGGSSSGSASAVAAGLVDIALGSDTGGSVRAPASFCGIVGLRPTFGRIDISQVMPLAESLDTVGWFTRDIALYERVGAVMLGEDTAGPPLTRMIVAEEAWACLMGEDEKAALWPAVDRLRALFGEPQSMAITPNGLAAWQETFRAVQGFQAWRAHSPWIESRKPNLMEAVRGRFEAARRVSEAAYERAVEKRVTVKERVHRDPRRRWFHGSADLADHRAPRACPGGGPGGIPRPRPVDAVHGGAGRGAADIVAGWHRGRVPARAVPCRTGRARPRADRAGAEAARGRLSPSV